VLADEQAKQEATQKAEATALADQRRETERLEDIKNAAVGLSSF